MYCVFGDRSNVCKPEKEESKVNETSPEQCDTKDAQKEETKQQNATNEDDIRPSEKTGGKATSDDLIGQMRWRKNNKTDSWYPLLVLSTDTESAIIWNGVSADKIDKTSLYQRGDMHRSLVKQSDMALKQLLSYSHTMMKSLHESQELVRETQAEMQQQNEQIHNQIKSSKDIKWMKWKHGYEPVRVVQPGDQNPNACFVFDIQNRLHNVDPCYLLPYPPYKKAFHIAAHVRKLNSLCTDYPWNSKDTIKCGRTKCSFQVEQSGWFTTSRGTITATIIAIESTN
eukprot:695885_1